MGELTKKIIQELEKAEPGAALDEAIGDAGFLIEKAAGLDGLQTTWPKRVLVEPIDAGQIEQLKGALVAFVSEAARSASEVSALWALGKVPGVEMRDIFIAALKRHLEGDSVCLFAALIGLSNIGEDVFGDGCGSIMDIEKNRALARAYLAKTEAK